MATHTPAIYTTPCGVHLAAAGGLIYPLTPCCRASGKGSVTDSRPGVVCRRCYQSVAPVFARGVQPGDVHEQVARLITEISAGRCPTPDTCATEVLWRLDDPVAGHDGPDLAATVA